MGKYVQKILIVIVFEMSLFHFLYVSIAYKGRYIVVNIFYSFLASDYLDFVVTSPFYIDPILEN